MWREVGAVISRPPPEPWGGPSIDFGRAFWDTCAFAGGAQSRRSGVRPAVSSSEVEGGRATWVAAHDDHLCRRQLVDVPGRRPGARGAVWCRQRHPLVVQSRRPTPDRRHLSDAGELPRIGHPPEPSTAKSNRCSTRSARRLRAGFPRVAGAEAGDDAQDAVDRDHVDGRDMRGAVERSWSPSLREAVRVAGVGCLRAPRRGR